MEPVEFAGDDENTSSEIHGDNLDTLNSEESSSLCFFGYALPCFTSECNSAVFNGTLPRRHDRLATILLFN